VESLEHRLGQFYQHGARVVADLANLEPVENVAPDLPAERLPALPESRTSRSNSPVVDFDPREHPSTWLEKEPDDVTIIGDSEGIRIGSLPAEGSVASKAKVL